MKQKQTQEDFLNSKFLCQLCVKKQMSFKATFYIKNLHFYLLSDKSKSTCFQHQNMEDIK